MKTYSTNNPRISFLEYFFVFVLIIYAGHANQYVVSTSIKDNPIWALIPVILSGILVLKWGVPFNRQFYVLIIFLFIYFFTISVKFGEFRPTYFLNFFFLFFTAYVTAKALNINLFRLYCSVIYYLSIVGLVMWIAQYLLGGDRLFNYFAKIPSITEFSYVSGDGLNAILYSVQPSSISIRYDFLPPRNSGFAWEPGGFASFISLAIFFNLFLFPKEKNSRVQFWVLVAALISTQSTTGYLVFLVIIIFYFYNKREKAIIILWPLVVALLVLALSLPFMSEKIISLIDEAKMVDVIVEGTIGRELSYTPQRFTSFVIAFRDFLDHPFLGLGGVFEEGWTYKIGANVSSITGIGNLLAQHGIVGLIFFLGLSYNTSSFFSKTFHYRGRVLFWVIIFFISISYGIILLPIVMSLWMFSYFTPNGIQYKDSIPPKTLEQIPRITDFKKN